jgi:hypothetical protein
MSRVTLREKRPHRKSAPCAPCAPWSAVPGGDRLAVLVHFLLNCRFKDEGAKTVALMAAFPGVSFEEVVRAEAAAYEIVKARIAAGDHDRPAVHP